MKRLVHLGMIWALALGAGASLAACDSNGDGEDIADPGVEYVQISSGGIGYYAASDTRAISPILVARNNEYEVEVNFVNEDGVEIDYEGYTYRVTVDDDIAVFTPSVRDGEFFGTIEGIELGDTKITFRLMQGGTAAWTSFKADLKVVE